MSSVDIWTYVQQWYKNYFVLLMSIHFIHSLQLLSSLFLWADPFRPAHCHNPATLKMLWWKLFISKKKEGVEQSYKQYVHVPEKKTCVHGQWRVPQNLKDVHFYAVRLLHLFIFLLYL